MELLSKLWNLILESNLFNFIFLVGILLFCIFKFDLKSVINSMQEKIAKEIKDAEINKKESEITLRKSEDSMKTLDSDIAEILSDAEKNSEIISKKIISEGKLDAENISKNTDKAILAEENKAVANLIKEISKASVLKSKENTIRLLNNNIEMHEKYINESIEKLGEIKI